MFFGKTLNSKLSMRKSLATFFAELSENETLINRLVKLLAGLVILAAIIIGSMFIFPDIYGNSTAQYIERVKNIFYAIFDVSNQKILFVYLCVFSIDLYCLGYKKSALRSILNPDNTTKTDIYIFLLRFVGLWRYVIMFSFLMIGYYIESNINALTEIKALALIESPVLQAVIFFLIYDFLDYWRHRFGHRISWWWSVHRLHHSAEKFNIITVGRSHPLDLAFTAVFIAIPMGIIGTPIETFLIFQLMKSAQGKLQHSMIDWDFGVVGKYLLMSPIAHRVHHSPNPIHWDKNFGHILVIWDRMFGTWYDGKEINQRVGLWTDEENKHGLLYEVIKAQLQFFSLLFSKWKFRVGVLKEERIPILSEEYKESCLKKNIQP